MMNEKDLIKFPIFITEEDKIPDFSLESNFLPGEPKKCINKEAKIVENKKEKNKKCQKKSKTLM